MPARDPTENAALFQRITAEINRLSEQQTEAMQKATVVGLTSDEAKEYNERRSRIADLVIQLAMIARRRAS
jgi:hypothetical protein